MSTYFHAGVFKWAYWKTHRRDHATCPPCQKCHSLFIAETLINLVRTLGSTFEMELCVPFWVRMPCIIESVYTGIKHYWQYNRHVNVENLCKGVSTMRLATTEYTVIHMLRMPHFFQNRPISRQTFSCHQLIVNSAGPVQILRHNLNTRLMALQDA